jgi:hypothetical protein
MEEEEDVEMSETGTPTTIDISENVITTSTTTTIISSSTSNSTSSESSTIANGSESSSTSIDDVPVDKEEELERLLDAQVARMSVRLILSRRHFASTL